MMSFFDNLNLSPGLPVIKTLLPMSAFISFDAGSREICLVRRLPSNTPLQALVTLNDPVYLEAAIHLAKDNLDSTLERSIKKMYTAATYRTIDDSILSELVALYQKAIEELKDKLEFRPL